MTLDEFIAEQQELLEKFKKHWRDNQKKSLEAMQLWPEIMDSGEWDEHFSTFMDTDNHE